MKLGHLILLLVALMLLVSCAVPAVPLSPTPPPPPIPTPIPPPPPPPPIPPPAPAPSLTIAADIEEARRLYPPEITSGLLKGSITPPEGFDSCIIGSLGKERLDALRSGAEVVSGQDNDEAALCLLQLNVPLDTLKPPTRDEPPPPPGERFIEKVTVEFIDSTYRIASGSTSGFFRTGQDADIALSAIDFNDAGGPLLFNHQGGIASDGTRLLVADRNNNRVLIWKELPQGNVAPDLVLGQKDFITNNPGTGRDQMNWPVSVATDGQHIVVADTYNDRILIWNSFPTQNGAAADVVIAGSPPGEGNGITASKSRFGWPWGVWTGGEKLVITSTTGGGVLIWNQFPTQDNQRADILLTGGGKLGTPRTITSDGRSLIVGDHNAKVEGKHDRGNFFWKTFPTIDDQPFDFFMSDPVDWRSAWLQGDFTDDGRLIMLGRTLYVWNAFPEDENDLPDISIQDYSFNGGDGSDIAVAGNRLYISASNGNKLLVYESVPTRPDQLPDFAIGSPDINTNTLETNFIMSNPVPASNGQSLFVSSDFDRKLYVWKELPDESGAYPDIVYSLPASPWDNALWGNTLALAGKETVYIWKSLPLDGSLPELTFNNSIGSVELKELKGVAIDDRYFYLADSQADKVYIWEGIPSENSEPAFTLEVDGPWRLSSDGNYLAVTAISSHSVLVYRVADLDSGVEPITVGGPGKFNLPEGAAVAQGYLFVADTGWNRVFVWNDIEDALSGKDADIVLGEDDFDDTTPEIGRSKLFWPATLSFDGSYLWIGEFKFSERLLRFSPQP